MREYTIVLEYEGANWSAYSPDVPGCGVTGETRLEAIENMKVALEDYLAYRLESGLPIPEPGQRTATIKVAA